MAGTLVIDTLKSSTTGAPAFQNTSGTEVGQLCKAWINFNGSSTGAIRASFNVSSLTYLATGQFQINFTTAMVDANYAAVFGGGGGDQGRGQLYLLPTQNGTYGTPEGTYKTSTFVQVGGNASTNPNTPLPSFNVAIFR